MKGTNRRAAKMRPDLVAHFPFWDASSSHYSGSVSTMLWLSIRHKFATTYCAFEQNHQLEEGVVGSQGPFGLELRGNPVRPFRAIPGLPPQLWAASSRPFRVTETIGFGKAGRER